MQGTRAVRCLPATPALPGGLAARLRGGLFAGESWL
jgi:hypothetical protein